MDLFYSLMMMLCTLSTHSSNYIIEEYGPSSSYPKGLLGWAYTRQIEDEIASKIGLKYFHVLICPLYHFWKVRNKSRFR